MTSSAMNDAQKALMKDVIRVYFSGGEDVSYKSVAITSATTADEVAHMMMDKINTPGFGHHFELIEMLKGKERTVKPDEKISDLKAAWTTKGWAGKKLDDPDFRFMLVFKQDSIKALDHMQKQGTHTGEKVDTGSQANLLAGLQAGKISAAALDSNKQAHAGKIAPSLSKEENNQVRPHSNTGGASSSGAVSPRGAATPAKPAAATSATVAPPAAKASASGSLGHYASNAKLPSVASKEMSSAQLTAETKAVVELLKALLVSAASTEPLMSSDVFDPSAHPEPAAPAAVAAEQHHTFSVAITLPETVAVSEPKKQEENAFMSDLDSMLANLAKATAELDN